LDARSMNPSTKKPRHSASINFVAGNKERSMSINQLLQHLLINQLRHLILKLIN
jgi:hypothetical protein